MGNKCIFLSVVFVLSLLTDLNSVTGTWLQKYVNYSGFMPPTYLIWFSNLGALFPLNGNFGTETAEEHGIKNIAIVGQFSKSKIFFTDSSEEATVGIQLNWFEPLFYD